MSLRVKGVQLIEPLWVYTGLFPKGRNGHRATLTKCPSVHCTFSKGAQRRASNRYTPHPAPKLSALGKSPVFFQRGAKGRKGAQFAIAQSTVSSI